jgi:hypothetical protein
MSPVETEGIDAIYSEQLFAAEFARINSIQVLSSSAPSNSYLPDIHMPINACPVVQY